MECRVAPRRRAYGFWGMVALVVVLEATVGTKRFCADPVALQWRENHKAIRSRVQARPLDVLCLGDSMIKYGVAAPALEAKLGRTVANFALLAAPPARSYFALRHAIEQGAQPRLVLVDFAPFLLLPGYSLNRHFLPETTGPRDSIDLAWTAHDPELGGSLLASQLVPTVRNRAYLRGQIGRVWRQAPDRVIPSSRRRNLWLPGRNPAIYDWFYNSAWEPGPEHRQYVERFIALATAQGATVVWVMPPIAPEIRDEWDALGLSDRYTWYVASVQREFPDLAVIDARELSLDPAAWSDPLHLTPQGAEVFTDQLAKVLDPAPGRLSWIDMADPAPRTALNR